MGLLQAASATSLTLSNYHVPSLDGKSYLLAVPLSFGLKMKPPTIAVIYNMKDAQGRLIMDIKRNKPKKYHHAIPIDMHEKTDLRTM
jgi:hypothetical protein